MSSTKGATVSPSRKEKDVKGASNWLDRARKSLGPLRPNEYEVIWEKGALGIIFSECQDTKLPIVSRITGSGQMSKDVCVGDTLLYVNTVKSERYSFSRFFEILTTMKKPVLLRFRTSQDDTNIRGSTTSTSKSATSEIPDSFGIAQPEKQRSSSSGSSAEMKSRGNPTVAPKKSRTSSLRERISERFSYIESSASSTILKATPLMLRRNSSQGTQKKKPENNPKSPSTSPTNEDSVLDTAKSRSSTPLKARKGQSDDELLSSKGHIYEVCWKEGSLGIIFSEKDNSSMPFVNRVSEKCTLKHQVAEGDTLLSANGVSSGNYEFDRFFEILQSLNKPVKLRFHRESSNDSDSNEALDHETNKKAERRSNVELKAPDTESSTSEKTPNSDDENYETESAYSNDDSEPWSGSDYTDSSDDSEGSYSSDEDDYNSEEDTSDADSDRSSVASEEAYEDEESGEKVETYDVVVDPEFSLRASFTKDSDSGRLSIESVDELDNVESDVVRENDKELKDENRDQRGSSSSTKPIVPRVQPGDEIESINNCNVSTLSKEESMKLLKSGKAVVRIRRRKPPSGSLLPSIPETKAHTAPLPDIPIEDQTVTSGKSKKAANVRETPDSSTFMVKWKESHSIGISLREVRLVKGTFVMVDRVCKKSCCSPLFHVNVGDILVEVNGKRTSSLGIKKIRDFVQKEEKSALLKFRHGPMYSMQRVSAR